MTNTIGATNYSIISNTIAQSELKPKFETIDQHENILKEE